MITVGDQHRIMLTSTVIFLRGIGYFVLVFMAMKLVFI